LNEYVSNVIKENIISQLEGAMDLEVEQIEEVERWHQYPDRERSIVGNNNNRRRQYFNYDREKKLF
jgi:hypothetical protein